MGDTEKWSQSMESKVTGAYIDFNFRPLLLCGDVAQLLRGLQLAGAWRRCSAS